MPDHYGKDTEKSLRDIVEIKKRQRKAKKIKKELKENQTSADMEKALIKAGQKNFDSSQYGLPK